MGTPGSGRYTTFVPSNATAEQQKKIARLKKNFPGGLEDLYEGKSSNIDAAKAASDRAVAELNKGKGDPDMFGTGVSMNFGEAPQTQDVVWKDPGDPANPYVPDLTSPGPGKTDGTDKDSDPEIKPEDVKPNFDSKNPTVNTTSPSATAPRLGSFSLGQDLEKGKSSQK
jgi:hypothetical protein